MQDLYRRIQISFCENNTLSLRMGHISGIRRCMASYNFHKEFYLVHRIGLTMLVSHPLYWGKIYFLISMEYTLPGILSLQSEPPSAFLPSVLCTQCFFWYSKLYCVHLTSTFHSVPKPPYIITSSYSWLYWWNPSRIRTRQGLLQLLAVLTLLVTNSRKERQLDYEI